MPIFMRTEAVFGLVIVVGAQAVSRKLAIGNSRYVVSLTKMERSYRSRTVIGLLEEPVRAII